MFCSKCGAAVNGKYCSCCGQRIRSAAEEYRLLERRVKKAFIDSCSKCDANAFQFDLMHLAEACWLASSFRYDHSRVMSIRLQSLDSMTENLNKVQDHAKRLYQSLIDF